MTALTGTVRESHRVFKVDVGQVRLDQFLALQSTQLTRAQLHRLIVEGQVLLNGRAAKPAQKVRSGDLVSLTIPPPRATDVVPQWIDPRSIDRNKYSESGWSSCP